MPTEEENKLAQLRSLEEKNRTKQEKYRDSLLAIQASGKENLKDLKEGSGMLGEAWENIKEIGKLNKRQRDREIDVYEDGLKQLLDAQPNDPARLRVILEQAKEVELKIERHKRKGETHNQGIQESILSGVIRPRKDCLLELVKLESGNGILTGGAPVPGATKAPAGNIAETPVVIQVDIPEIPDKPLVDKKGKNLNNAGFIASSRKFRWSDDRIPDMLSEYLRDNNLIRAHQSQYVKTFFLEGRSGQKIAFKGTGAILATIFFEIMVNGYLATSKRALADKVEQVFGKWENTGDTLVKGSSFFVALIPSQSQRRVKKGAPRYPEIINYLSSRLSGNE